MNPTETTLISTETLATLTADTEAEKKAKKEKKKKKKASKGVETMFRTTLANHLRLSEMADRKANLMISINAILISITMSSFLKPVSGMERLLIPEILLLIVSLVTVIISIFATKPTFSLKKKMAPDANDPGMDDPANNRPVDLLFFGDYTQLTAAEYRKQLRELISDDKRLYNSLIDNIYAQGRVLIKKYRLLTIAYSFFMIGFSVVVICCVIVLLLNR
ncbi:Pycsar system effector family protein [Fibrella aquatica]|uniref:Pycsar system effector family protein n=1 Tax=Fibrella aquatica TaxID=3242487 RepID=UPI003520F6CF